MPKATHENFQAIIKWQEAGCVHPLTCGNDSGHANLLPSVAANGDLVLRCTDCDYVQTYIPEMVLHPKTLKAVDEMKKGLAEGESAQHHWSRGYFCAVSVLIRENGRDTNSDSLFSAGGGVERALACADAQDIEVFRQHGLLPKV